MLLFVDAEAGGVLDDRPGVAQQNEYVVPFIASRRRTVTDERCFSSAATASVTVRAGAPSSGPETSTVSLAIPGPSEAREP